MKNRAALSLAEQVIMVLVFSVAAAICMRVFVYADSLSRENLEIDKACLYCQNAAETLKYYRGDMDKAAKSLGGSADNGIWTTKLDAEWHETQGEPIYLLKAESLELDSKYIGGAKVYVVGESELFSLQIRWQEGD